MCHNNPYRSNLPVLASSQAWRDVDVVHVSEQDSKKNSCLAITSCTRVVIYLIFGGKVPVPVLATSSKEFKIGILGENKTIDIDGYQ